MDKNFIKFLKGLSIFTLFILSIGIVLFLSIFKIYFLIIFPFVLIFYYFSTLLLHRYMLNLTRTDVSRFSFKFMMLSFLKMFVYIVFGVLYIVFDEENAVNFLIVYLILYVTYAVFEVKSIMKLINESKG